jgi:hypothetical protein
MSYSVALQDLIIETLKADADIAAIVGGRVYDQAPENATFPYITLGSTSAIPDDAECVPGVTETVQIDIWHRDQGRKWRCKETLNLVYAALHDADLEIDSGALAILRVVLTRVENDPDKITAHGIVQVDAMVET